MRKNTKMDERTNNQEIVKPKSGLVKVPKSNKFLDALFQTRFKLSIDEDIAGIQFSKDNMSFTFTLKNPNYNAINDTQNG